MNLPEPLESLVRPDGVADGWTPPLVAAVGVVLLAALVNGVAVGLAAGPVADAAGGTIAVDNPDRPPEGVCDSRMRDCSEPKTVQRDRSSIAFGSVFLLAWLAAGATVFGWFLLSGFALVVTGGTTSFETVLRYVGWSFAPAMLRYVARPFAVLQAVGDWTPPSGSVDAVRDAATLLVGSHPTAWYSVVVVGTLAWQGAILAYGLAAVSERDPSRTALVGVGLAAVAVPAGLVGPTGLTTGALPYALVAGVLGVPLAVAPRFVVAADARTDLVGMDGELAAKPWYVTLHLLAGVSLLTLAFAIAGGAAFV